MNPVSSGCSFLPPIHGKQKAGPGLARPLPYASDAFPKRHKFMTLLMLSLVALAHQIMYTEICFGNPFPLRVLFRRHVKLLLPGIPRPVFIHLLQANRQEAAIRKGDGLLLSQQYYLCYHIVLLCG